jgi:hypothetical protein
MATGRTVSKWTRVYADGYDLSGHTRSIGPLAWEHDEASLVSVTDGARGVLPNVCKIGLGTLNGVFDNTDTTGLHVVANGAGVMRTALVPIGMRAAPAQGDCAFMGQFEQGNYVEADDGGSAVVTLAFDTWSVRASSLLYGKPWGWLLHAHGAETAANTAVGIDDLIPPATSSARGGYMVYQLFASNAAGTVVVKVQDAATNVDGSFADLSGCTTSAIGFASIPSAGLVAISPTATVRRYLRWQIVLAGGMTTVTFALGFVRGQ